MSNENDTERLILAAAEQEFVAKGMSGARTTVIAERAGVTHAMLHYYFRSKELLFERILRDKFGQLIASFFEVYISSAGCDMTERMSQAVGMHFDYVCRNPLLPLLVLREIAAQPDSLLLFVQQQMHPMIQEKISLLQADMDQAASHGEICPQDCRMLLVDVVALNAFSVAGAPMMTVVSGIPQEEYLRLRREENITMITKRLKP